MIVLVCMASLVHLHPRMLSHLRDRRPVLAVVEETLAHEVFELVAEVEVVVDLHFEDVSLQVGVVFG